MEHVVNWSILSNPMNWAIIFGVLYLVALCAHVLYSAASEAPIALPQGL